MRVVLWDSRRVDFKPPRGSPPAGLAQGFADRLAHFLVGRCRPPVPLLAARLAAVFKTLGHTVEYAVDRFPRRADLVVFFPAIAKLGSQCRAIQRFLDRKDQGRLVAVGPVAGAVAELLQDIGVAVIKGEPEQLLWKLDAVLNGPAAAVQLGMVEDLDALPFPEWAPFSPWLFRSSREFWQFPTARIEASRGEGGLGAGYRYRSAGSVVQEIEEGIGRWGFYSFQFCDTTFGRNRGQVFQIAEQIRRMPHSIQFSIQSRADFLPPEMLRVLRRLGLSCVTLAIDTRDRSGPGFENLAESEAVAASCRRLGIRTIADFRVSPAETASETAGWAWNAARRINATFAQFRVCPPPSGLHHPAWLIEDLHDVRGGAIGSSAVASDAFLECLERHRRLYYARSAYWRENHRLLLPALARLETPRRHSTTAPARGSHTGPPRPLGWRRLLGGKASPQENPPDEVPGSPTQCQRPISRP